MVVQPKPLWPLRPFLLPLVVFLLMISSNIASSGVQSFPEKKFLSLHKFQGKQKSGNNGSTSRSSCLSQKSRWESGATILEMKHRDSCTGKPLNWNKKQQNRLIFDNSRYKLIQSRLENNISRESTDALDIQIPLQSGVRLQTLNYIVTVELGGRQMTVIVDTGSDLTWVQCQPCQQCYNQQDPVFNPSVSPSYQSVLCNTSTCQSLQFATGKVGVCGTSPPNCKYVVNYGDGSYTRGDLGMENLMLGTIPVSKFIFGCGRSNEGLFGGASGLMGLGRSDISLVTQTSAIFGGFFSYCLPLTDADSSGSLVLGGNSSVYRNTTTISYTRMIPNPQLPTFYFVNLTGISVGGVGLQSPSFGNGGVLIDSGTVITRLPPSIYKALKAEFLKQFSGIPSAPPFMILDTCFNLTGYEVVDIPTIRLEFEGNAELAVDVTGIFYFVKPDASQVCLALASLAYEDEIGIIGNYQQRNQRVIYDTKESKLGFAAEACSFD
ncbi:hypothetical protein Tsubulata_012013 [Turnera subulata]|uniref:Peptidase A1 domain-containing protein n=1 Tax=Turnera subulata TaxID=218843 RepID=A0A9Q0FB77_9ROSI|nr:hypothetical protein Tsubulata_012013 [Turnera subulata]